MPVVARNCDKLEGRSGARRRDTRPLIDVDRCEAAISRAARPGRVCLTNAHGDAERFRPRPVHY